MAGTERGTEIADDISVPSHLRPIRTKPRASEESSPGIFRRDMSDGLEGNMSVSGLDQRELSRRVTVQADRRAPKTVTFGERNGDLDGGDTVEEIYARRMPSPDSSRQHGGLGLPRGARSAFPASATTASSRFPTSASTASSRFPRPSSSPAIESTSPFAPAKVPVKKHTEKKKSTGGFWGVMVCLIILFWGLWERDKNEKLRVEVLQLHERTKNLTRQLTTAKSATEDVGVSSDSLSMVQAGTRGLLEEGVGAGGYCGAPKAACGCEAQGMEEPARREMEAEEDAEGGLRRVDHLQLRRFAFVVLVVSIIIPVLCIRYMDDLPRMLDELLGRTREGPPKTMIGTSDEEVPLSKKLAYKVDVWFSTYSWVKSGALLAATLVLINLGGLALYAVSGDEALALVDATWRSWTYVADAGNHADSSGIGPRVVAVIISFGGMLIFALMVGLVTESISEKVDSLRKGKSDVIEREHTLVLGWSDKLASLVKQLAMANESAGGGVIVIMSEMEKEEMELEISKLELDLRGSAVICRSGSALVPADLKKVSVSTARAIVVLAEAENADAADAHALRVVLSLSGVKEGLRGHVVVELADIDNEQLVKMVGGHLVETVVAHDVIGRLMIQCARQPGLAHIWETLLGFENCEFYAKHWPQLEGLTFRDVLISFPDAIPIGLRVNNETVINPDDDYVLQAGDDVLVIAEDDDSYAPGPKPVVRVLPLPDVVMPPKLPEKILFCGWRRDIDDMIVVLEAFLARGSELWIFSDVPIEEREERLMEGGLNPGELENMTLVHRLGNAVIRRHLESLPLETFDSILILADERHEESIINSDSRSLATLLLIRDIQSKRMPYEEALPGPAGLPHNPSPRHSVLRNSGSGNMSSWVRHMQQASAQSIVISEILDSRTRSLISVSKISDYVLSNELVSMALAMVAEDREVNRVLSELFAEEGNELYIRPAELYLLADEAVSFFELMLRARKRREVMIGYRRKRDEHACINPPNKHEVVYWSLSDSFIVLSFEE